MLNRFYSLFIKPFSRDPDTYSRELVLNYIFVGAIGLGLIAIANTFVNYAFLHDSYLLKRLVVIFLTLVLFLTLYIFSRRKSQLLFIRTVLVGVFLFFAGLVLFRWGIINPVGVLLLGAVVVMASVLLGSRYSLYSVVAGFLLLTVLEYSKSHHYIKPDMSWTREPSSMTDVVSFTALLLVIALISWLFNRQMEMSLARAQRSERALKRQKALLEIKVEQRTRQLQAAQTEKMQQFYRFAELGLTSTALFHDLANHMMSVSIDVEGLKSQRYKSALIARIQENTNYIDSVVQRVHQQVQGKSQIEKFNVTQQINEVIKMLSYSFKKADVNVVVKQDSQKNITHRGDLTRFRQLVTNLLCNAIEAYPDNNKKPKQPVIVVIQKTSEFLTIEVTDRGIGIKPSVQAKLFEPFYTTKKRGVGIGLFIVKQITESDLGGTVEVKSNKKEGTTFTINLPLHKHGSTAKN